MKYDFVGYATKNDVVCSDGRVIRKDAFAHQDGEEVALVWQHRHDSPDNVLGRALLKNVKDGVRAFCSLNNTPKAKTCRELILHGDIKALSIWANGLNQKGENVVHGDIREVSLVISPANPGALIDNDVILAHSAETGVDSYVEDPSAAMIVCGISDITDNETEINEFLSHAEEGDETGSGAPKAPTAKPGGKAEEGSNDDMKRIFNSMTDEQKDLLYTLVGMAAAEGASAAQANAKTGNEGGSEVKHNAFENNEKGTENTKKYLSHDQFSEIMADAQKTGSLRQSFISHASDYGIDPIEMLFPDAKALTNKPYMIDRDTSWVAGILNGAKHSPFTRIKTMVADVTGEEARARGYMKGNRKKEEVFTLMKRSVGPTTVYKKQKLDRDDIIDITDLDVVSYVKGEMRGKLDEEIARAILFGDGREIEDEDKIDESCIIPVWKDDPLYSIKYLIGTDLTPVQQLEMMRRKRRFWKGTGTPTLYTTEDVLGEWLLIKDANQRYIYKTEQELCTFLRVSKIVTIEQMEHLTRMVGDKERGLFAIMLNIADYTIGTDKGGQVSLFDDFDIDFNQYKYLMETRLSGMLINPFTALVFETSDEANPVFVRPAEAGFPAYGNVAQDFQRFIKIEDGDEDNQYKIKGVSNYFGGNIKAMGFQNTSHNFICLRFSGLNGNKVKVKTDHAGSEEKEITDGFLVLQLNDDTTKLTVTTEGEGLGEEGKIESVYDLTGIKKEKSVNA